MLCLDFGGLVPLSPWLQSSIFPVENSTIHYSVLKQKISCIFKVQRALSKRPPVPTHTHAPEPAEYNR